VQAHSAGGERKAVESWETKTTGSEPVVLSPPIYFNVGDPSWVAGRVADGGISDQISCSCKAAISLAFLAFGFPFVPTTTLGIPVHPGGLVKRLRRGSRHTIPASRVPAILKFQATRGAVPFPAIARPLGSDEGPALAE
jgi:hypothetical protein